LAISQPTPQVIDEFKPKSKEETFKLFVVKLSEWGLSEKCES